MDTSSLTALPEVIDVNRDSDFFDQYKFCIDFYCQGVTCLRDIKAIQETGTAQSEVVRALMQRRERVVNWGGSWRAAETHKWNHVQADDLSHLVAVLWPYLDTGRLIISSDWGYFYTNDLSVVSKLQKCDFLKLLKIKQAVHTRPKNTVLLENSKYTTRTYFKEKHITMEAKTAMMRVLGSQENIRVGPGLNTWLTSENKMMKIVRHDGFVRRYHFFDHDNTSIPLMLELIVPGIIRKTMPIIAK